MDDIYIEKVRNGDMEAFRYFIQKYQHMAFSVALSVVKTEYLAQEVVQEAFLNVYQNIRQYRGDSKFSTWLYRIVVNKAFRLAGKEQKVYSLSVEELGIEVESSNIDNLTAEERKYFINETLKKMPPKESLALRLFYLQEMALKEIGDVTGWSLANVKVILHRARKGFESELRQLLKNEVKSIL